ncbi:1448_t:CDS:1, partial [Cetraspora pellucida]
EKRVLSACVTLLKEKDVESLFFSSKEKIIYALLEKFSMSQLKVAGN